MSDPEDTAPEEEPSQDAAVIAGGVAGGVVVPGKED